MAAGGAAGGALDVRAATPEGENLSGARPTPPPEGMNLPGIGTA